MHRALALIVLLLAAGASADNTADESDIAFGLGNAAYAKRDYEHALSQYLLSYRLVPNRNVLFNIAKCYEALDRFDEAYRYWHDLSLEQLADDDKKDVQKALTRLSPRVALVHVVTTPVGADLYVDREDLGSRGRTPQTVAVPPGAHTIIVKRAGHRVATAKFTVARGREAKQTIELERIVGKVELTGSPAGAVIRETADGPELGKLPTTLSFAPGQKLLVVQAPGHLPSQVLVEVKADATAAVKVALTEKPKPTGKVIVTANRDNAVVRVDGRESGFTPVVLSLIEGAHTIEITTAEVTPLVRKVNVVADAELRLAAELRYAPPAVSAASKSALTVDQAPASVTVITREEIQGFGYQTVAEALAAVRGFFLTDDRIYTYIGVRGFSPPGDLNTRVLILYDGHPMNDVWAGQGFAAHDLDVDLSEVDRIEVVRGPTSTLYGTGAFFGVINVVPREHLAENRHVEGTTGTGGQGGVKARVTGSLGGEGLSALVSAAAFDANGAELTDLGERGLVRGLDGERTLGASARAKWGDLAAAAKFNTRRKVVPTAPFGANVGVPGTTYTDSRGVAELRFEHAWSRVTLGARASYDNSRYRGTYAHGDPLVPESISVDADTGGGDWLGAEVRAAITLFEGNRLTVAVEGQQQFVFQKPVDSDTPVPHARTLVSATLLDEWQLFSRLFLQVGARADKYFDLPDIALSPRAALVLKPYQAGLTKLVAGQAFRAPNTYELYFNDGDPPLTQRAPATLKPELITTFEAEHSHDLTPELRITAGGYYNLIDRLVVLAEDPPESLLCGPADSPGTIPCVVYGNSSRRVTAAGAEGQLRWQPGRFTLVEATYSFVVLTSVPDAEEGDASTYPAHLASLRALVPIKEGAVRLSGQVTYQSTRKGPTASTGEALLVNVGISGEYGPLRYFAGVQNVLDQRYSLPVASEAGFETLPQYGRTFWLQLSAGF